MTATPAHPLSPTVLNSFQRAVVGQYQPDRDGDLAPAVTRMDAPTVCQCSAPLPCTVHPDDRPWLKRPPARAAAAPAGTVGRLDRAPEPGGAMLEVEARSRLPKFCDEDLLLLYRLHAAELARRGLL